MFSKVMIFDSNILHYWCEFWTLCNSNATIIFLRILCSGFLVWDCEEVKLRQLWPSNSCMVLLLSLLEIDLCNRIMLCSMIFPFVAYYTMSGDIRHTLSQSPLSTGRTLGWYDRQITSLLQSPRQRSIPILESYLVCNVFLYLVRIASILQCILLLSHDIIFDSRWSERIGGLLSICLVVCYFSSILAYQ